MNKLNLGCGKDIRKGYINLDVVKLKGVDIVADVNKKLPFENNYFDEILAYDILEHVENLAKTIKELHRVLKEGGKLRIKVPHYNSPNAFADPTHKNFFSSQTFIYFQKTNSRNYYFHFSFKKVKTKISFLKKIYFPWNYLLELIVNVNNLSMMIYENTILKIFPSFNVECIMIK